MLQVKLFILCLNPMTDRLESRKVICLATSIEKLKEWYFEQKSDKPYNDDKWYKNFKKGSELEWFNPLPNEVNFGEFNDYGHGVFFDWFNMEETKNNGENKFILNEEIQNIFGNVKIIGL